MKIFVKAKPGAKKEFIKKEEGNHYIVSVKDPPKEGKANRAIIQALSEYFNIPHSNIEIISGHASRQKIIEIDFV